MSFPNSITNGNKVWAMKKHGSWYKNLSKKTKSQTTITLGSFLPEQPEQPAQSSETVLKYTPVESAMIKLGSSFLLSLDSKATEEESVLQKQAKLTIYYSNEWRNLFNVLETNILKNFILQEQNEKDKVLLTIIADMCKYGLVYNEVTIRRIIKPYMDYLYKKNNLYLPKIVVIPATPPGKSISNCEEHIKSKLEPHISGKNLIHLFPGESETKIPSVFLIRLLNNLTNGDRIEISKNLQEWIVNNPDKDLVKILKGSCPTPVKIPYYKSLCLCKNCKFTVSDSGIDEFLEKEHKTSFRNKKNEFLLKIKPTGDLLNIAKKFLYIQCHSCSRQIAISSIIPKYLDMSKDEKPDESYKIAEKAKLYLYKIIEKLAEATLLKQFPDLSCCICLSDKLSYEQIYQNQDCKHEPCICLDCNNSKTDQGRAIRGNLYVNSNYQCMACTAYEPTGNPDIDEFNKNGGVQPGYVGRFCYECNKPFQQKPETCGVEQDNNDISLYCIDCIIYLAEYNKKIRLSVICPNPQCNTPISRYDGCDQVECLHCNTTFCYGCEYIFINPPEFEWNWSCSCVIDPYRRPKEYNDKSQSVCENKYIEYQERRGVIIQPLPILALPIPILEIPIQELAVPEIHIPISEVAVPEVPIPEIAVPEVPIPEIAVPELENSDININIININYNYINIGAVNPSFQEIVSDEDDIQRQILLAMQFEDDFSHLY